MTGSEIRAEFLEFFASRGHKVLPSASLIPDDKSLLLTVAGVVPFKPILWGKIEPIYPRIATVQKCVRTADLDNVGRTARHHTFFEMLGNFSFGDYFKKEAIKYAWEFVTRILKLEEEKLWISTYLDDDDAFDIWRNIIGIPEKKIVRMGKEDNFWGPVGHSGPCGPCSEIFYDTGPKPGCERSPEECDPTCECGRFVELWNLVFTEYYADENGTLYPLPSKNIDTGAGLERVASVVQGVPTNFDTDLILPIINAIEVLLSCEYGKNEETDVSIKIIADHIRAITFLISDGVLPSNDGRGYVLKRLIRRAMRRGILLGHNKPFLYSLVDVVVDNMKDAYPELVSRQAFLKKILKIEEERFGKTLTIGVNMLKDIMSKSTDRILTGEDAFKLYDTYGFPLDVIREITSEKNFEIDEEGFKQLMEKQQANARKARKEDTSLDVERVYRDIESYDVKTEFIGYESLEGKAKVLFIIKNGEMATILKEGEKGFLIFDKTPFYAEKGGQVGDIGVVITDTFKGSILDTTNPHKEIITHKILVEKGSISVGEEAVLRVNERKRKAIVRNHTATHLLHAALRRTLGEHVRQSGSLVSPERMRFDFSHYEKLSEKQVKQVENMVNEWILMNLPVNVKITTLQDARKRGAMVLFEEKYGERVRLVEIDDVSKELCGGTHVKATGEIGMFRIISESAVSSGIRRIEAVTGEKAYELFLREEEELKRLSNVLSIPIEDLPDKINSLLKDIEDKEKEIEQFKSKEISHIAQGLLKGAKKIGGVKIIAECTKAVDMESLKKLADLLTMNQKNIAVILSSEANGKVSFIVKISDSLTDRLDAGRIAKEVAKVVGGSGGGRRTFASAGGKDTAKINEALSRGFQLVKESIS